MKLYATITSERASKGQGGNEFLEIRVIVGSVENQHILARLTARPDSEGYGLYDHNDNRISQVKDEQIKGKEQEGEHAHEWELIPPNARRCKTCKMFLRG